jgi:hypothetical protein
MGRSLQTLALQEQTPQISTSAGLSSSFNFTDDGEWSLRDSEGDVVMFEEGFAPGWRVLERADPESIFEPAVEVQCDFCGRWSTDAAPSGPSKWRCYGAGSLRGFGHEPGMIGRAEMLNMATMLPSRT